MCEWVGGQMEVDGSGWEVVKEGSCCNNRWFSVLWLAGTERCDAVLTKSGRLQSDGPSCSILWISGKTSSSWC